MKNGKYELVVAPSDYPGKKYRGRYCYEHILVYWKHTGHLPKVGEMIHHINKDTRDNRYCNLELMEGRRHGLLHAMVALKREFECAYCHNIFERSIRHVKIKLKNGQKDFYCNRVCMAKHFGRGRKKS